MIEEEEDFAPAPGAIADLGGYGYGAGWRNWKIVYPTNIEKRKRRSKIESGAKLFYNK